MDTYNLNGIILEGHAVDLINSLHRAGLPLTGSSANRGYTLKSGKTTIIVVNRTMPNSDQEWHLRVVKIPQEFITREIGNYYEVLVTNSNKWRVIKAVLGFFHLPLLEGHDSALKKPPSKQVETSTEKKTSSDKGPKSSIQKPERAEKKVISVHLGTTSKFKRNSRGKAEFEFAVKLQQEAEEEAKKLKNGAISGAKCWYCDANLIENGAIRAFVGINPGGGKTSEKIDVEKGSLDAPYAIRRWNSWLDEDSWEGKGRQHQERVKRMFKSMYGKVWEEKLRESACLNVVPFRTESASRIPAPVWIYSQQWFRRVIEHIRPKLILCNGNGEAKSPWAVLCSFYRINDVKKVSVGATGSTASLKEAVIESEIMMGTRIIGLPLLNRFGWPETFRTLATLGPFV